jgi:hypothetical protein
MGSSRPRSAVVRLCAVLPAVAQCSPRTMASDAPAIAWRSCRVNRSRMLAREPAIAMCGQGFLRIPSACASRPCPILPEFQPTVAMLEFADDQRRHPPWLMLRRFCRVCHWFRARPLLLASMAAGGLRKADCWYCARSSGRVCRANHHTKLPRGLHRLVRPGPMAQPSEREYRRRTNQNRAHRGQARTRSYATYRDAARRDRAARRCLPRMRARGTESIGTTEALRRCSIALIAGYSLPRITRARLSNSMLEGAPTTPQDYPE